MQEFAGRLIITDGVTAIGPINEMTGGQVILFFIATALCVAICVWAFTKITESVFNIMAIRRALKSGDPMYFGGGGIAYNIETGKLEETGGRPLVPF